MRNSFDRSAEDPPSPPDRLTRVSAAGLTGLIAGLGMSLLETIISTLFGNVALPALELAHVTVVFVPLGCLAGILIGIAYASVHRKRRQIPAMISASLCVAWCFGIFVYLAVYCYGGLGTYYLSYFMCAFLAIVLGIPTYAGIWITWRWLSKAAIREMVIVGCAVGLCCLFIESIVVWGQLWTR